MKKILLTFLILISIRSFAQDPELDDNTWYLQNVIINGEANLSPVNEEITDITLDFFAFGHDFQTAVCNGLYGELGFDDNNSTFTLLTTGQTLIVCGMPENSIYENLYFGFYYDNQSNPFTYSIITSSSTSTLTITAANGDQAIYGNARLHVNQVKLPDIKMYPNPVANKLTIDRQNNNSLNLNVYNMTGQLIISKNRIKNTLETLDVSDLKPGVYFFVLEANNQRKDIRKIIKI